MDQSYMPDRVYRAYDMRGIYGEDLNKENVERMGRGYATWLIQRQVYDCVVGYDCRLSSKEIRDALVKGLTDSGITVYDIGLTLSQIAYFAQYHFRTRGMLMITASHNPAQYNGFKLGTGYSETMVRSEIVRFYNIVNSDKYESLDRKGEHIQQDITDIYVKDVVNRFLPFKKQYKVVVEGCAATAGAFMPDLLRAAGCEVIEQNCTPDGNFPLGEPDPTEKEVQERLAKRVVAEGADLGFSYDCDGDRVGIVDETGNLIWNDTLLCLFSKDVLHHIPDSKIVYNALCSKQLDDVIRAEGGTPILWLTGHSFIKAKIREERAEFGGELSGHIFFVDNFYGHDDGAFASLRLLSYLDRRGFTLSEAVAELPQYISSPEIKMGCPEDIKFDVVSNIVGPQVKELYPNAKYIEIDGVRVETENEMFIIRASQNGPYLTVKFEAKDQAMYDTLKKQINKILYSIEEIDFSYGVNLDSLE